MQLSTLIQKRGDNKVCTFCGGHKNLTIDHIIPRSRGGTNALRNKMILCKVCNGIKGNMTLIELHHHLAKVFPKIQLMLTFNQNIGIGKIFWRFWKLHKSETPLNLLEAEGYKKIIGKYYWKAI